MNLPAEKHHKPIYKGRFAPAPSGFLHFGSLVAAVGSFLDARSQKGKWLVRIEDVDDTQIVQNSAAQILKTLETLGFYWDETVIYQSARSDLYRSCITQLQLNGDVFPCACSNEEIALHHPKKALDGGFVYPKICRNGLKEGEVAKVWRLKVSDKDLTFTDRVRGAFKQNLAKEVGDIILVRADGVFAYQLASVIDDAAQGINAVVRGGDILNLTIQQIYLQQCLGLLTPTYAHLPVVVTKTGEKLSKQSRATPINAKEGSFLLAKALRFLGHDVPKEHEKLPVNEFWQWVILNWQMEKVPKARSIYPGFS